MSESDLIKLYLILEKEGLYDEFMNYLKQMKEGKL